MEAQIICEGCKSQIPQGRDACPFCGHTFLGQNPEGALSAGVLLHGQYTIGKCISADSEGYTYSAIFNETKASVIIKEFAPPLFSQRGENAQTLFPLGGQEMLFKTLRMDFEELYTLLVRLGTSRGSLGVRALLHDNGTAYGVIEDAQAITLREYITRRRTPLTAAEVLSLLGDVAYAVEGMHRLGVIHRGICPDTVYVTGHGETKLGGYATQSLRTVGTELDSRLFAGYSAPEQYSIAEFDGYYTDVYALGALYYFALTGRDPLDAQERRRGGALPLVKELSRQTPSYLSSAIARAMRMQSVERIQTVREFVESVSCAQKPDMALQLNGTQKILFSAMAVTLVCILGLALWLLTGTKGQPSASQSDSDASLPVISEPLVITAPGLVGQSFVDVQSDPAYQGVYLFTVEEVFSTIYNKGEIVEQSPIAGTQIDKGQLIHLKVSIGPETALMPEVIGWKTEDAEAELQRLKIQYTLVAMENDGSYIPYTVAKSDRTSGTVLEIENDSVVLYIAKEPAA